MRWIDRPGRLVLALGGLAAIWSVVNTVNATTRAPATVRVPVMLTTWGSTRREQALSHADRLVVGLGGLVGALTRGPLPMAIGRQRPFQPGNARRPH